MGSTERTGRSRRESGSRTPPPRKRKSRWSRSRSRSKSREQRRGWRDCSPLHWLSESYPQVEAPPNYRVPEEGELVLNNQSAGRGPHGDRAFNQGLHNMGHYSSRRAPTASGWNQPPINTGNIAAFPKHPLPPPLPKQTPPLPPQGPPPDHHQASIPRPPAGTPANFSGPPLASSGAVRSEFSQEQQPTELQSCEDLKSNSRHGGDNMFQRPFASKHLAGHNQYQGHRNYGRWNQRWDTYPRNRRYDNNNWGNHYHRGNNRFNSGYGSNRHHERGRQQRSDHDWFPNGRLGHPRNRGYQHQLMPDRFGHNMHRNMPGRNRNEYPSGHPTNQYSGYPSAARERFGNGYGQNWEPSWGPGRPPDNTFHEVRPEFDDRMKFDLKPGVYCDISGAGYKQEEPASWLQWDCGSGNSWVDPYGGPSNEVGQQIELGTDVLNGIVERQQDIMDSGLRSLATRLGVNKGEREGEGTGRMDAAEKVAVVQKMLGIMCNENDTDYKCSDSEDEWGRRRKPYRITYRMRTRALEELSKRAAHNAEWALRGLEKSIVIKSFPLVPANGKILKQSPCQEMKLPQSSGEVALISWDQPQHLTEDPRLPSSALQALPEEATAKEDLELGIPSFAMSKFIRGFEKRYKVIQKLSLAPEHQRLHVLKGARREAINGVQKFNFINPKGALSSSGYTLKTVHNLTEKIIAKGRKMVLPNSVALRKEDNLWLQVREEPYSSSELEDQPRVGLPLATSFRGAPESRGQSKRQISPYVPHPSEQEVVLQLFWNTGWDREETPILVYLKAQQDTVLGRETARWLSLRSLTANRNVLGSVVAELKSRHDRQSQSGSNPLKRKAIGVVTKVNVPLKIARETRVDHETSKLPNSGPDASRETTFRAVKLASDKLELPDESALNLKSDSNSLDVICTREGEAIETESHLPSDQNPSLVYVRPGVQHLSRLAGLVGTQTIQRAEGYFVCLMKSAVDMLKKDTKLRTENEDAKQHKLLQPQTAQGQQRPSKRKSQVLHTTPRKRRQGKLNARSPLSMDAVTSPPMQNTPGKEKDALPTSAAGTEPVARLEPASAGPTTARVMRGRGRGRGHRRGGLVRQVHSAPRNSKSQQGQTANGNHSQANKQPRKTSGFSNDGASVASWILNCTFRSVTLEEQEAAAKADTRKL